MKRIILALTLSLSLGACASLPSIHTIQTIAQLGTASVANPITKQRLFQMESAVTIVFAGLNTWKRQCQLGTIPATCRDQIAHVQIYTRQIPPALKQLRAFVKEDDQVNAVVVFNRMTGIIADVKALAATNNIQIGS